MVASFGITAVIITDSGRQIVPAAPSDEGNPVSLAPEDPNITSGSFPESV